MKFGDIFPLRRNEGLDEELAVAAVIGSFVVMASIIGLFTARLWRMNQPLVAKSDPDQMAVSEDEKKLVVEVYNQQAELNPGVKSLESYEARSHRLLRLAERSEDAAEAKRLRGEAAAIFVEVRAALARGQHAVIRRRATEAILDKPAKLAYFVLVAAVIGFAVSADYLESERTKDSNAVKLATECAAAVDAGADQKLLADFCSRYLSEGGGGKAAATTAEDELGAGRDALAAAFTRCEAAVRMNRSGMPICERLRAAVLGLMATIPQPPPTPQAPAPGGS